MAASEELRKQAVTILLAGLVGAAIDAAYFSGSALLKGHSPAKVLQSIAAFFFGPKSFEMGSVSAVAGLATHIALATIMAAGFVFAYRRLRFARQSPMVAGVAYGAFLYVLMYTVVMPLRWPALYPRWDGANSGYDIAAHLVIGLAFAFVVHARQGEDRQALAS